MEKALEPRSTKVCQGFGLWRGVGKPAFTFEAERHILRPNRMI